MAALLFAVNAEGRTQGCARLADGGVVSLSRLVEGLGTVALKQRRLTASETIRLVIQTSIRLGYRDLRVPFGFIFLNKPLRLICGAHKLHLCQMLLLQSHRVGDILSCITRMVAPGQYSKLCPGPIALYLFKFALVSQEVLRSTKKGTSTS